MKLEDKLKDATMEHFREVSKFFETLKPYPKEILFTLAKLELKKHCTDFNKNRFACFLLETEPDNKYNPKYVVHVNFLKTKPPVKLDLELEQDKWSKLYKLRMTCAYWE